MRGLIYISLPDSRSIRDLIAFYGEKQRADMNGVRGTLADLLSFVIACQRAL